METETVKTQREIMQMWANRVFRDVIAKSRNGTLRHKQFQLPKRFVKWGKPAIVFLTIEGAFRDANGLLIALAYKEE